jgi:hypothetical protein
LEIILHIGNFLNAGTPNGGAYGFKLATLTKLAENKPTNDSAQPCNTKQKVLNQHVTNE